MNIATEENTNVGDFSSNLNGYSGRKGKTRRAKVEDSLDKNKGLENTKKEEENQRNQPQNVGEEKMEEDMRKKKDDITGVGATLSFLHTTKLKVYSSLQGDSWMYN